METQFLKKKNAVSQEELLKNIAEASKNTKKIFTFFLSTLFYSYITALSTTDRNILLNESIKLPIFSIEIPYQSFSILFPLVAISFFIYLQIYLFRLKEIISFFKSHSNSSHDFQIYPWIINFSDDAGNKLINRLQRILVDITIWWLLPVSLYINSLRFYKTHDLRFMIIVAAYPVIALVLSILFRINYVGRLTRKADFLAITRLKNVPTFIYHMIILGLIVLISPLLFIPFISKGNGELTKYFRIDVRYQKLTKEYSQQNSSTYLADFQGKNLSGAVLGGTVLNKSNLRFTNLSNAYIGLANLNYSDLGSANLQNTQLIRSNLKGALLDRARLITANFRFACLDSANFSSAIAYAADFTNAEANYAIFDHVHFVRTEFIMSQLRGSHFYDADLQYSIFNSANLQGSVFWGSNLKGVNFEGAILDSVDFTSADITEAILANASLKDVKGIELDQFSKVKTLFGVKNLDIKIYKELHDLNPQLFECPNFRLMGTPVNCESGLFRNRLP